MGGRIHRRYRFKRWLRRGVMVLVLLWLAMLGVMGYAQWTVHAAGAHRTYDQLDAFPGERVGLLLGTGKYLGQGRVNAYYTARLEAAASLYHAGKIQKILVSGDNGRAGYDEPTTMREDLLAMGVLDADITLDYAGFSTLDSVIRCRRVFGQSQVVVISQRFHNERAIYLASHHGLAAVGYNARDVRFRGGWKVWLRERLARVKAMMDITCHRGPRYLGSAVDI